MKKILMLVSIISIIILLSCNKEEIDPRTPCEIDNWGHVKITSTGGDYEVEWNGVNVGSITDAVPLYLESMPSDSARLRVFGIFNNFDEERGVFVEQCTETVFSY